MTGVNNLNVGLFIYSTEFHPTGLPVTLHLESCLEPDLPSSILIFSLASYSGI